MTIDMKFAKLEFQMSLPEISIILIILIFHTITNYQVIFDYICQTPPDENQSLKKPCLDVIKSQCKASIKIACTKIGPQF